MATLKNTTINDTSNLTLPSGNTAQRPSSPNNGEIRYNTDLNEVEIYVANAWRPISDTNPEATGGTIIDTDIGGVPYRLHLFTSTGNSTFTVSKPGEVEYLIVGGGGGGGGADDYSGGGGGGGAGGFLTGFTEVSNQAYTITVGAGGGAQAVNNRSTGPNGGNSSAFGLTAIGGGGGGSVASNGGSGGSGGGAGRSNSPGSGTTGQGNNGAGASETAAGGGGGGGAGSAAGGGDTNRSGGLGGAGRISNITGLNQFFAGGGGGGQGSGIENGRGGVGGGGAGGRSDENGSDGKPNTGGGGGGAGIAPALGTSQGSGMGTGAGGSGIVIVRYRRNASTSTNPTRTVKSSTPYTFPVSGRHFYNIVSVSQGIDQYYLTTPFDVSTRILQHNLNPVSDGLVSRIDNMAITDDGGQLYVCASNSVLNYTLRVPFDISTADYNYRLDSFHSATEPTCFQFANDGKIFYDHKGAGEIEQYDLSIPYDIRTRSLRSTVTGLGFPNWGPGDPAFSPDGGRVIIGHRSRGRTIIGGTCTIPFDLTTFVQETEFLTPDQDPSCCKWNGDGTTFYVRHASPDMVNEISCPNPYSLVGASFVQQVMPSTSFAAGGIDFNYSHKGDGKV